MEPLIDSDTRQALRTVADSASSPWRDIVIGVAGLVFAATVAAMLAMVTLPPHAAEPWPVAGLSGQ